MSGPRIEIGVLGASTLTVGGAPLPLNARRMRSLLAALVLGPGPVVSSDRLVDALWEQRPSAVATNTLQGYVSRMRRLLESHAPGVASTPSIDHVAGAYRLTLGADGRIDAQHFDAAVTNAQEFLRTLQDPTRPEVSASADTVEVQRERLDRALATWRGEPYADLATDDVAVAERRRLTERRVDAQSASLVMDLMLGRAAEAAAGLEELVDAHPLREQLWRLWAVALVRIDRQAHALEVLARLRLLLSSELGIDPSPAVTALQEDILRQDPSVLGRVAGSQPRPAPFTPPTTAPASPLLGRARELRLLQDAVGATARGRGRHAVLVAEPGLGKSRLVADVLDWAKRRHTLVHATLRGAGHPDAPPLWPLVRAARTLAAQTGIDPPDLLREPAAVRSFEHVAGFADFVRAVALASPVLLVAEDLHRIDESTLAALVQLAEDVVDLPVMLVATRRPGVHDDLTDDLAVAIARTGGHWLELAGLDADDARQLVGALAPDRRLSDQQVELLRVRTGGNPRHLATLLEEPTGLPIPLVALVRAELRQLPPSVIELLRVSASTGRRFSIGSAPLDATSSGEQLSRAWETARRSGLVRPTDDGWEFSSPVVHEAVQALIPPRPSALALVADLDVRPDTAAAL